nr:MAG TPA: intron associated endonuclease [Bacteriophage sp.]
MWTVYKHTAPNGKVYIGITGGKVKNRWQNGHGYKKQIFYRAIKKYGWENINHEILFEGLTKKQAGEMEQHLIEKYDCIIPKGYNKSKGGEYGSLGVHPSAETRRKISEGNKGKHQSAETRRKMSEASKGKHHSSETRQKLSEANKGKHHSPETRRKISEANKGVNHPFYGKHHSVETRQKLSEANKGKHHSSETRQKLSEANKGKHLSAEHRKKISEANKGYKPTKEELQKRSEGLKRAHKEGKYNNVDYSFLRTEEYRKKRSEQSKELWKDEAHKKVFLETLTRIQHDPEARRKAIEQLKITNNKPEIKAKFSGKNNGKSKQTQCIETGEIYPCVAEASRKTGAPLNSIAMCCRGERKTAGGYHWKYVEEQS